MTIVAAHTWATYYYASGGVNQRDAGNILHRNIHDVLWHDSTLYFTLISGLLFSRILVARGWSEFFRSKVVNVLLPYSLMSLLFTISRASDLSLDVLLTNAGELSAAYLDNLLNGTAIFIYWYIPVLAILFLLTPAVFWLVKRSTIAAVFLGLAPLIFSRTDLEVSVPSVIYFLGAYALGVYFGIGYEDKLRSLSPFRWPLLIVAIVASFALLVLKTYQTEFLGPVSVQESVFYVQKLALAAVILITLARSDTNRWTWLNPFASLAFAIYFLHFAIISPFVLVVLRILPPPQPAWTVFLAGLLCYIFSVALTVTVCLGLKRILGPYSRMVIGA